MNVKINTNKLISRVANSVKFLMQQSILYVVVIISLGVFMGACQSEQEERDRDDIKLAYANWAEGVAISNLAAVVLEDELGYDVVTKMAPVSEVFELVASGEYHVFADVWLPKTHGHYVEEYSGEIETIGTIFNGARTGLVVPDYVDAQSITDLQGKTGDYNGQIVGIEPTAGIMKSSRAAIDNYSLEGFELIDSSGPVMADSLRQAIMKREPIVLTGWVPHWIWAEFNIRFLEDPQQVFGEEENIHAVANAQALDKESRAAKFFSRFSINRVQLSSLMSEIRSSDRLPAATAREWVQDNPAIVNDWVEGIKPKRERIY